MHFRGFAWTAFDVPMLGVLGVRQSSLDRDLVPMDPLGEVHRRRHCPAIRRAFVGRPSCFAWPGSEWLAEPEEEHGGGAGEPAIMGGRRFSISRFARARAGVAGEVARWKSGKLGDLQLLHSPAKQSLAP